MKKLALIAMALMTGTAAYASKKECTNEPDKKKWMSEADFKKKIEGEGYTIKKFKTPGTCYEIYGTNKQGQRVEIYFNPVTAEIVKSEIKE